MFHTAHRYFFYKNMAYTLTQFWFNLYTAFSGQRLYDDWYQVLLQGCHMLMLVQHGV